jgi:hypothetical protein
MSVPGEAALAAAVTEPLAGTDAPTAPAAEASDTISLEAARKLRSEHESLRARLRDAEAKLKGHEDAALTEQEKARKDATDAAARAQQAEARLRQVTTERAIERAARDLSMSEELAVLLTTGHAWEYDDEGALRTNVRDVLKRLVEKHPQLVAQAAATERPSLANPGRTQVQTDPRRIRPTDAGLWQPN